VVIRNGIAIQAARIKAALEKNSIAAVRPIDGLKCDKLIL
jgi:hypothetical protein